MMSKKERLSREKFNRFFSVGRRHHAPHLQLIYTAHPVLHASVVISKKIEPLAVKRNKLRRRIYDCVRNYAHAHKIKGVFIFIAKAGSSTLPFPTLKDETTQLIQGVHKVY